MDGRVYAAGVGDEVKVSGTDKTLRTSYGNICDLFTAPETLLVDGGSEFDNKELRNLLSKEPR